MRATDAHDLFNLVLKYIDLPLFAC